MLDARLHPDGLSDADLVTLHTFGLRAALAAAPWPRGAVTPEVLFAGLAQVVTVALPRLERHGLRAHAMLGVPGLAVPRRGLHEVLQALPSLCRGGKVKALGPMGLADASRAQEAALEAQLELAELLHLPVLVSVPAREREKLTRRTLDLVRGLGLAPERVLIEGATERTRALILARGCVAGLCLHPDALRAEAVPALVTKHGTERLVLSSAAGAGAADLLALPRAVHLLEKAKLSRAVVSKVSQGNAEAWLALSPS